MIKYQCPECGEAMESPDSMHGEEDVCPDCGVVVMVPDKMDDSEVPSLSKYECLECGESIELPQDMCGEETVCPNCGETALVPYEDDETDTNQPLLFDSPQWQPAALPFDKTHPRKRGWLKNLVAVFIGIGEGIFFRFVIGIPLVLLFSTKEGLPPDVALILEVFTAFVAGAMAGSLVPRLGWLAGGLTQVLKLILTFILISVWLFIVATNKEVEFPLDLIRVPIFRLLIISIVVAGIAGYFGERYRKKIHGFLATVFGLVGGALGCLLYCIGGIAYLYFLYLGGKALFEEGTIFKALLYWVIIGPLVSAGMSLLLYAIVIPGSLLYRTIYNWYAPDLELEKFEAF